MEFSAFTFFKVVFWLLSPFILFYGIAFIIGIAVAPFITDSSLAAPIKPKPEPTKQENKCKELGKKKKTALQWAAEQQKKENARQAALARQAEQVRIAAEQRANYAKMGMGH